MSLKRGEIYFVNLNPVQGREQAGTRPVLILSSDFLNQSPLVITVVIGTKGENIKKIIIQLRSIDISRFPQSPSGQLSEQKMLEVEATVRYCLGL
jgi:mRNA interferase MazF